MSSATKLTACLVSTTTLAARIAFEMAIISAAAAMPSKESTIWLASWTAARPDVPVQSARLSIDPDLSGITSLRTSLQVFWIKLSTNDSRALSLTFGHAGPSTVWLP